MREDVARAFAAALAAAVYVDPFRKSLDWPVQRHTPVKHTRHDALVIGEALMDVITFPDGREQEVPGGSAANTALALGRLNRTVALATNLGDDDRGAILRTWLTASGVEVIATADAVTSVARARLQSDGSAEYSFDLRWNVDLAHVPMSRVVHAGSLGAVLDPGADAVESFVSSARTFSTISIDPNIRAVLLTDAARDRLDRLFRLADVIKLSDEDQAWLAPNETPAETARRWLEAGTALVVVTHGSAGAAAFSRAGDIYCDAVKVETVDTVGAGDTFTAALLDGLTIAGLTGAENRGRLREVDRATVKRILARSALAAAVTVSRRGANPPMKRELQAFAS